MNKLFAAATLAVLAIAQLGAQVDSSRMVTIPGHINARALAGTDNGRVEANFPLNDVVLTLKPSAARQAELDAFLAAQQDPSSPDYHNWLTPGQFADRFGPSASDVAQITGWLGAQGLTVREVASSRNAITFSGTAAVAQAALGVDIHRYTVAGQSHFATATEPRVPAAFAGLVAGFRGLDDFLPQHPRTQAHAAYTSASGNHYLAPDDAATIYNFSALYARGYDGTGQTIAIVGQSAINLTDVESFRSLFNLTKNDPTLVSVPNLVVPGVVTGDVTESDLDVEWAGAVAKNASVVFVYSTNVFNALQYAVTQNLAPVISISYGTCETGSTAEGASLRVIAQQANAEGITLVSASGDTGPFACESNTAAIATHGISVTLPASIPEVTGVGGTQFSEGSGTYWNAANNSNNGSVISYIPEAVWNETADGGGIGASGGGASAQFAKPTWQAGPGVPPDGARDVPDLSMAAAADHDGAIICSAGGCATGIKGAEVVGGTSVATPLFAGIAALLNQYQVKSGALAKPGLGNINPTLYALAQNYGDAFHDITTGDNVTPCRTGSSGCTSGSFGYAAGPGYDQATGLGSVNAYALATDWSLIKAAPAALTSVTVNPSTVAGGGTALVTVTLSGAAPSGGATVALSGGSTAFPLPASIVVPAGQFTAGVSVASTAVTASTSLVVTASYSGTSKTASVTVAPVVLPTLTSVSVTQAAAGGGSAIVTVSLSAAAPAGGASVSLSSSSTAFPVPASILVAAGARSASITVQTTAVTVSTPVTITAKYNGGTQTAAATVAPVVLPTLTSVSVSQASVVGGASVNLSVNLNAAAPAGGATVTLSSTSAAFPVPATLVVPAGARSFNVNVLTTAVTASTNVTVTAKYNGGTQNASVTLTPVVLPALSSVAVSQASVVGGANVFVTVNLSAAAPPGGSTVTLSSNSSAFPVPASVVIPAGRTSVSTSVQTTAVTASTPVTITAKYNGGTQTASVTLTPVVLPTLKSVTISQFSSNFGACCSETGTSITVTLTAAAPPGGATVTLASSNAAIVVPASVVVPYGQTAQSVLVQPTAVTASTTVTITAKYNSGTQTASITLAPVTLPNLSSVTISPSSLPGGATALLTVQLSAAAPSGGSVVTLSSNSAAFPVPATTTVPAGLKEFGLFVQTSAVKASTPVTVTATYNGGSQTATATLTPVVIPTLTAVASSASSVKSGGSVTLTFTLSGPAPPSGAAITLSSSSAAFPLPATVTIFPGSTQGQLRVQTKAVTAAVTATVTASSGGTTQTATVTVTP